MKVKFKHLMNGYTGNVDDTVIYYVRKLGRCVVRSKPVKHDNPAQKGFRSIQRNIWNLEPSEGYREDLKAYLISYDQQRHHVQGEFFSWVNLYVHVMFSMAKVVPDVDLATITRQQIYDRQLPCICVKDTVEAGLLCKVQGWEGMVREM